MATVEVQQRKIMLALCETYLSKNPTKDFSNPKEFWNACLKVAKATDAITDTLGLKYRNNPLILPPGHILLHYYKIPVETDIVKILTDIFEKETAE